MALVATNRGVGGNITASTSIIISPNTNLTVGSLGIIAIAYDNSGSAGADPYTQGSQTTDSAGNVWISRINRLNDPGAASAGSSMRIFTCDRISSLTTSDTITFALTSSTTAKAWTITEVISNTGNAVYSTGASTTFSTAAPTITTSSITIGSLVFGAYGGEGNGTRTADSDTTNGTWSTAQQAGYGTTTSGMEVLTQYKVVTATGTQIFNPTLSAATDNCIGWIQVLEVALGLDPMGMLGFFGI